MQNSTPDVIEQVPAGGGVNKPASGTYGEKAALDRLKQQLPQSQPAAQPAPVQPVPTGLGPSSSGAGPAGLPRGLTAPTGMPDVPVSTPLQGPPPDPLGPDPDVRQRRLQYARLLATQGASPEIREWGQILVEKLTARG